MNLGMFLLEIVICFVTFIVLMPLVCKLLYLQIGSTCGFYALIFGISKIKRINKKKIVKRIIMDFVQNEDSYVGEIFDIEIMLDIINKYFSEIKAEIININGIEDLDKYLQNNYVIYPCNHGGIPHYYFLEKNTKSKYIYRHVFFWKKYKLNKDEFYAQNSELGGIIEFVWKDYYDTQIKGWLRVCSIIANICEYSSDSQLYRVLKNAKNERREKLYDKKTPINMYNKILIIDKHQSSN